MKWLLALKLKPQYTSTTIDCFLPCIYPYYAFHPVAQYRLNNIIPTDKSNSLYVTLLTYI